MFEASGFAAEAERIRKAFAGGDPEAMLDAVSDDMLDAIGVAGTPDQVPPASPAARPISTTSCSTPRASP